VLLVIGTKVSHSHADSGYASRRASCQLAAELDLAVEATRSGGALGARMTGGVFGGSAIALTPVGSEQQVRAAVEGAFFRAGHAAPGIFSVRPAVGARRLAQAERRLGACQKP